MEAWGSKRTGCTLVKRDGAKSIFALSVAGFAHTMQIRGVGRSGMSLLRSTVELADVLDETPSDPPDD
jgi:hypothetical protein